MSGGTRWGFRASPWRGCVWSHHAGSVTATNIRHTVGRLPYTRHRPSTPRNPHGSPRRPAAAEASAADPVARKAQLVEDYTERFANPYIAAERGYVDDVIDPAETRRKVIAGFAALRTKREELPRRKHGVIPL